MRSYNSGYFTEWKNEYKENEDLHVDKIQTMQWRLGYIIHASHLMPVYETENLVLENIKVRKCMSA